VEAFQSVEVLFLTRFSVKMLAWLHSHDDDDDGSIIFLVLLCQRAADFEWLWKWDTDKRRTDVTSLQDEEKENTITIVFQNASS